MLSLDMATFPVREATFGAATRLAGEHLIIDRDEILRLILEDPAIRTADVEIVEPGESARVIHVCDVIEPRLKVDGAGTTYPGVLSSDVAFVGRGRTHRLAGLTVIQSAEVPRVRKTGTATAGEAFFDMSGPGAMCPFARTINVVICLNLAPGLSQQVYERTVKQAGFKVSQRLAETTRDLEPPEIKKYELGPVDPSLPRVLYVHQAITWTDTPIQLVYFYGQPLNESLPTLLHPNELMDGAVTSVSMGGRGTKAATWMQVNNPIVDELYARHGHTLNFLGVMLMRTCWQSFEEKIWITSQGAKLAKLLDADGVIVTWLGAGNAFMESMLTVEACEKLDIKGVLVTYEHGGPDRMEPPVIFFSPLADAVVSTGAVDIPTVLPPVQRVIGGSDLALAPEVADERIPADGEIKLRFLQELYCSVDMWGFTNRRCITC